MLRRRARAAILLALTLLLVPKVATAEVLNNFYGAGGIASGVLPGDRLPVKGTFAAGDGAGRIVVIDRQGPMDGDVRRSRVTRFAANGQPDTAFGAGGDAVLPSGFWPLLPSAVAGHGIAIWGLQDVGDKHVDAIIRLTEDGALDSRFNDGEPFVPEGNQHVTTGFLGEDGTLVLFLFGAEPRPQVVVYREDGALDTEFGGDGSIEALGVPVARDGLGRTTWLEGSCSAPGDCSSYQRLRTDGTLDDGFGVGGTAVIPAQTYGLPASALGDGGGSVLYVPTITSGRLGVTRLVDGSIDADFGTDGRVMLPVDVETVNRDTVLLEPLSDGGLAVVAGYIYPSGDDDPQIMAVLTPDGELDPRFGIGGVRATTQNRVIGLTSSPSYGILVARTTDDAVTEVAALYLLEAPIITGATRRPDGVTVDWHVPDGLAADSVLYEVYAISHSLTDPLMGSLGGSVDGYALVAGDVRSVTLTGLDEGVDYGIWVQPINRTGYGRASDPLMTSIDLDGPVATVAGEPQNIAVDPGSGAVGVDRGRVRVRWEPAADNGAPITAYSVAAFNKNTGQILAFRSVGPDVRSAVLTGLTNGQATEVWVFAWNAQGLGEITKVDVVPGNGLPLVGGPAVPWAAGWRTGGHTVVTWGAATEGQEPLVGYDVVLLVNGVFRGWHQTGPDGRQIVLPLIPGDQDAQVYVFAHGASTLGPLREPITVTGGLG